ncbi:hypothetical protein EDB80DRAFT_877256 [Ilyonectria destructans]|nr:hypothetical protein EDB80DRAFT_877256 [Ilyonectria destructans]
MAPQTPVDTTAINVPSLGKIKGLLYDNGVRQFCGIPYADLAKRWSRSTLKSNLPGDYHDGTQHGRQDILGVKTLWSLSRHSHISKDRERMSLTL